MDILTPFRPRGMKDSELIAHYSTLEPLNQSHFSESSDLSSFIKRPFDKRADGRTYCKFCNNFSVAGYHNVQLYNHMVDGH